MFRRNSNQPLTPAFLELCSQNPPTHHIPPLQMAARGSLSVRQMALVCADLGPAPPGPSRWSCWGGPASSRGSRSSRCPGSRASPSCAGPAGGGARRTETGARQGGEGRVRASGECNGTGTGGSNGITTMPTEDKKRAGNRWGGGKVMPQRTATNPMGTRSKTLSTFHCPLSMGKVFCQLFKACSMQGKFKIWIPNPLPTFPCGDC